MNIKSPNKSPIRSYLNPTQSASNRNASLMMTPVLKQQNKQRAPSAKSRGMLSPTQGKQSQSAMPARPVTAKKRMPSANKIAARSSYMQPTFSRVMTMAVSGQMVAKVGKDDRGKAAIVNASKVDAPEWKGVASYLTQSKALAKMPMSPSKRAGSPKKRCGPLSLASLKSKYQVQNAAELSEETLLQDIIPQILASSQPKRLAQNNVTENVHLSKSPSRASNLRQTKANREARASNANASQSFSTQKKTYFNGNDGSPLRQSAAEPFSPQQNQHMDQQFNQLLGELHQVRDSKNNSFYEDHNNYYKGEVRRDITDSSVKLLQKNGEQHLNEQYQERLYGKEEPGFKVNKRTSLMAQQQPLKFIEKEVQRTSMKQSAKKF